MFLSRVELNLRRQGAQRLVSSRQRMHAAVLSSFAVPPRPPSRDGGRVLWRLDERPDHRATLYVVSPDAPDFTHVAEVAGWPRTGAEETVDYDPWLEEICPGQQWRFRIVANPVRYARRNHGERAKRVPHTTPEHQARWLVEQGEKHGFLPVPDTPGAPAVVVSQAQAHVFRRVPAERPVSLTTVRLEGALAVTDADALRSALVSGVGPERAYGCGLLTLVPTGP